MAASARQRNKPAPLAIQVMHAELRVLNRRRLVGVRATMLGQHVRRQLTSPAMLLLAAGLGFLGGHFPRRRASTPGNTEGPSGSHNKLFARALKLFALGRALSRAYLLARHSRQSELEERSAGHPGGPSSVGMPAGSR